MILDWKTGKGVHQWYAEKDGHIVTADSYHHLMIYVLDFEQQERDDE